MEKTATVVRQAGPKDVPTIAALIRQLAKFERLTDACIATDEDYAATLFKLPAFQGPTVLLLELDPTNGTDDLLSIDDPEKELFKSSADENRVVIGLVLFFPNYSTFLARSGLHIEDLYIREPFRRKGLGTILLQTVAKEAAVRGFGRVEWCVLDWNEGAIKFYKQMGAVVHQEWRICRLSGEALQAYKL